MSRIDVEDFIILGVIKTARGLVRLLPRTTTLRLARRIGGVLFYFTKRRHVAVRNLRAAFASEKSPREIRRIAKASIENLAMSMSEILRFPEINAAYVAKHIDFVGLEKAGSASARGKGIIFLAGHFGNWELLTMSAGFAGYPIVGLARRQKHPRSDAYLNRIRSSTGSLIIQKGFPVREILRTLKRGHSVGILSDQDGGRRGVFVPFFGRLSSTPEGAAAFSKHTGAAIIPIFISREGLDRHRMELEDPIFPEAAAGPAMEEKVMARFAELLEAQIRRKPEQWLWAHRRWKSTPDRFVVLLSDGRAGHLNQSRALADAVKSERFAQGVDSKHFHEKVVEITFRSESWRKIVQALCWISGGRLATSGLLKAALTDASFRELEHTYADVVISCGSGLLGANVWLSRENRARSAVVMKPSFGRRLLHAIVAPRHDGLKPARNIFVTQKALSPLTPEMLDREACKLQSEFAIGQGARIGFLVGGNTDGLSFDRSIFSNVLNGLSRASRRLNASVLASTSRRTPPWADEAVRNAFGADRARCPVLVIANESNRDGVVPGILGLSDVVLVSGESISMVSEAVSAGRTVIVFYPFPKDRLHAKHRRFLGELQSERRIRLAEPDAIASVLEDCLSNRTPFPFEDPDREILRRAARALL